MSLLLMSSFQEIEFNYSLNNKSAMKKLNLIEGNSDGSAVISRSQLKKIFGGFSDSTICSCQQMTPDVCFNCCISSGKSVSDCTESCFV